MQWGPLEALLLLAPAGGALSPPGGGRALGPGRRGILIVFILKREKRANKQRERYLMSQLTSVRSQPPGVDDRCTRTASSAVIPSSSAASTPLMQEPKGATPLASEAAWPTALSESEGP